MKLEGKAVIITGGGRGIGRAAAIRMADEGASVMVISRTKSELEETVSLCKGKAVLFCGDVSSLDDVNAAIEKAISTFGRIDILVNNAAIRGPVRPLIKVSEQEWERTLAVNVGGAFLLSKAAAPCMIRQGGGKIINITSGLGEMVMSSLGTYSITKASLNHLTRVLAEELKGHNIQVNALDPGAVYTRMHEELIALGPTALGREAYDEFIALRESGYVEQPEDSAGLIVFLASSDSDSITGVIGNKGEYIQLGYNPS